MRAQQSINLGDIWNSVALEERFELVARTQARGIATATLLALLSGALAYGFDSIWGFTIVLATCVALTPRFTARAWEEEHPAIVAAYLSVRIIAERYATALRLPTGKVLFTFRGKMRYLETDKSKRELGGRASDRGKTRFENYEEDFRDVWICLMQGSMVMVSERPGGAHLEFISPIVPELILRKAQASESDDDRALVLTAAGQMGGVSIILQSDYPAALYVFEKQLSGLLADITQYRGRLEKK